MVIIVFVQVIMRYIMGHSISWSEELTRYMFVGMIYMGVNLGIRDEIQIKIDVVDMIFKGKALKMIKVLQYVITLIAIAAGIVGSYYLVKVGFRATSPSLHMPMWMMYIVFPIGFFLDFIEVIRRIMIEAGKEVTQ
ncbi:MAG: TRAP transporter small permease [Lachnospiraceae bacterium]|nr:TRAP transporter small permease [Lachnospiraceae bacterium]